MVWFVDRTSGIKYHTYADNISFYVTNERRLKRFKVVMERSDAMDFVESISSALFMQMNTRLDNSELDASRRVALERLNEQIKELKGS